MIAASFVLPDNLPPFNMARSLYTTVEIMIYFNLPDA